MGVKLSEMNVAVLVWLIHNHLLYHLIMFPVSVRLKVDHAYNVKASVKVTHGLGKVECKMVS